MKRKQRKYSGAPVTRLGWHEYYANKFNKSLQPDTEHLAIWYQFLHLAFDQTHYD